MLVLSRKLGERIAIDGEIQLEVLEVSGNRVRLGIVAPHDCRIMHEAEQNFASEGPVARDSTTNVELRLGSHLRRLNY